MTCWKCGREIDTAFPFCGFCGADWKAAPDPDPNAAAKPRYCFTCGAKNDAGLRFCIKCGAPLDGSEAAERARKLRQEPTRQAAPPPVTAVPPSYAPPDPETEKARRRMYPYEITLLVCGLISLVLALLFGGYDGPFGPHFEVAFYGLIFTATVPLIVSAIPASPEDRRKKPAVMGIVLTVIQLGFAIMTSVMLVESAPTHFYYGSAPAYFNILMGILMPALFIRCLVGVIPKQE